MAIDDDEPGDDPDGGEQTDGPDDVVDGDEDADHGDGNATAGDTNPTEDMGPMVPADASGETETETDTEGEADSVPDADDSPAVDSDPGRGEGNERGESESGQETHTGRSNSTIDGTDVVSDGAGGSDTDITIDEPERGTTQSDAEEAEAEDTAMGDETDDSESEATYTWEDFKEEYYFDEDGNPPMDGDTVVPFDPSTYLGFDPKDLPWRLKRGLSEAESLSQTEAERTVSVAPDLDEDAFFSTVDGHTTVTNRYDLEKAVQMPKKRHFREVERYWVNKPFAFVIIFHSEKENEKKYYLVEPHLTPVETELQDFLTEKLRTAIKYAEEGVAIEGDEDERRTVIERETERLLNRYNLFADSASVDGDGFFDGLLDVFGTDSSGADERGDGELNGITARPEPVLISEDDPSLSEYQFEKLLYVLKRDFVGYERIDGIKHDINVEDISCDGYNSPVFVYHTDYEQLITNVHHGEDQLDGFVVKLAQRAGKGISKRQPQVDATLPDGSRAQLTLGTEVSDHGTNYTIRQFKDVPFTPVDLINWKTFSLDEMAFLWLCIENNESLLFAGGTASGKTTSLNAVSLFIPSNAKIVSIEDTREVELPQRNWIASVTRPSFGEDETGDIDEFDLLEAALRQRPDYIIMGEVRGEEGRTLFQVMSTGHTTYTTFHADNVSEVIKRFTTDPINVSKTLFTALDLISIQAQTRIRGKKVRRSRNITEIRRYDAENDEINVNDVFQWRPETDSYRGSSESTTLEEIKFDRGWSDEELDRQLLERRVVLAYLIENGLDTYTEVAATIQAYINDPETILTLVANDDLETALSDLSEMESVLISVDPEKEEMVPRPDPDEDILETASSILEHAESELFPEFRGAGATDIASILTGETEEDVIVGRGNDEAVRGEQGSADGAAVANGATGETAPVNRPEEETSVRNDDSDPFSDPGASSEQ